MFKSGMKNLENIKQLIENNYRIKAESIFPLVGYDNLNYLIKDKDGQKFVCKQFKFTQEKKDLIHAQCKIIENLSRKFAGSYPSPILNKKGEFITKNKTTLIWILKWVEGKFLHEINHTPELFHSFGWFLAKTDKELSKYSDPVIKARRFDWDLQHFPDLRSKSLSIPDPSIRKLVDHYFIQFKEFVLPELPGLRKSIIHNDANDWNVLSTDGKVSGLIDFGDMVYTPLIQELSVALAYAIMNKEEPLEWAAYILKSYHKIFPLEEKEIDLLYYLIAARLCMTLIHSFHAIKEGTADDYTIVSQKPAIDLLNKWISISPDKAALVFRKTLGFKALENTDYTKEIKKRHEHIGRVLSVSYIKPIKMKRAAFQYMYDADGNTYLDAYNNIPHVGHQHPKVVEAGQKQMALLNTNTRYLYDQLAEYADQLISKFSPSLNKVFFVNSGSAASDLAIRMAQTHSGNSDIVVMEHGYHGHTRLGVDISHYKFGGKGGVGQKEYIIKAPIPDTYRGEFKLEDAGVKYANQLENHINKMESQIAAFIAEPIVGCGGQVPLAPGYLKEVYPMIRNRGGVCISDEVQTGFGRIGTHFWGFEMHGVIPDIVVLGKPMGNGHPIGAVVTTNEIAESFDNGMEFFSSFGGNPVSCAIGMAVLDVIKEEGLQQNALDTGSYFLHLLSELKNQYECVGDVRGHGLFLGVELVKNKKTLEHHTELAQWVKNKLREKFILVSTDGPEDNILKMKPPMCFNKKNAKHLVSELAKIIKEFYSY